MIQSKLIPADEQTHYWNVVRRCLTEFHRLGKPAAAAAVKSIREEVERMPRKQAELFFHAEPFDVACRIASKDLDVTLFLPRYLEIRERPTDDEGPSVMLTLEVKKQIVRREIAGQQIGRLVQDMGTITVLSSGIQLSPPDFIPQEMAEKFAEEARHDVVCGEDGPICWQKE